MAESVTLEAATQEIMKAIDAKADQIFGEKWKGNTDMVKGLTMKVVMLQAFDMEWALPHQYQTLKSPILRDFDPEIREVENLYLQAANEFARQGLDDKQAINEARNQMFMATAEVIPQEMVTEIQDLIHTSLGSGKC